MRKYFALPIALLLVSCHSLFDSHCWDTKVGNFILKMDVKIPISVIHLLEKAQSHKLTSSEDSTLLIYFPTGY